MEQWNRKNYYHLYRIENGARRFENVLTANNLSEGHAAALKYIPNDCYWRGEYVIVESIKCKKGQEMTFTV